MRESRLLFLLVGLCLLSCTDSDVAAVGGGRGGASDAGGSRSNMDAAVIDSSDSQEDGESKNAGDSGSARDAGQAGMGGSGGRDAAAESDDDAGDPSQGGSGGGDSGDPAYDQCLSDALSAGQHVDDCTRCLCQADNCRAELNVATHDESANAVVICSHNEACTDTCCLCGEKTCGLGNYGSGPCASEVKVAAGVEANSGIEQALVVSDKCARDGEGDNSCRRAAVLAYCGLQKCPSECPTSTTCQ